jgi:hypothetical protein
MWFGESSHPDYNRSIGFEHTDADSSFYTSEGIKMILIGDKFGYHDSDDRPINGIIYEAILPFYKGKARVRLNGEWFNIDKTGKRI